MSFTFHLPADARHDVPAAAVLDGLFPDALRGLEAVDRHGSWPHGRVHACLQDRSVRTTEIGRDKRGIDVRIMSCANRDDHALALELVRRFAAILEVPVEPEEGPPVGLDGFDAAFGAAWVDRQVAAGPASVVAVVDNRKQTLTMPGAVCDYALSPERLEALRRAGPETELAERLLEDIRVAQWSGLEELAHAAEEPAPKAWWKFW